MFIRISATRGSTQDVDVILDVRPDQIRTLAKLLAQDYLIDADAWIDAFRHGQPFNIFYQPTFTKIDVMPLQTIHLGIHLGQSSSCEPIVIKSPKQSGML